MNIKLSAIPQTKSLSFISTLVLISFLTIGGCSENNGAGVDTPAPQTSCTTISTPCTSSFQNKDGTINQCVSLTESACAVDLEDVVAQLSPFTKGGLTNDTVMWIEAWGGAGGTSQNGPAGGDWGYAVTTTTVNDIKSKNNDSSIIYYFLGSPGLNSTRPCGAGGGVATIVTTEDLVLNPTSDPTQSAPPILLLAAGGGGGPGFAAKGCFADTRINAGGGGVAIATMGGNGQGPGGDGGGTTAAFSKGGNLGGMGSGGAAGTGENPPSGDSPTAGADGFGALGGVGGDGQGCVATGANNFTNTPLQLSLSKGLGGKGGSHQADCVTGGGGGGGGYGGGGGGAHGNETLDSYPGAGGGSFAIQSTKTSALAPATLSDNPCFSTGCVRITFAP